MILIIRIICDEDFVQGFNNEKSEENDKIPMISRKNDKSIENVSIFALIEKARKVLFFFHEFLG